MSKPTVEILGVRVFEDHYDNPWLLRAVVDAFLPEIGLRMRSLQLLQSRDGNQWHIGPAPARRSTYRDATFAHGTPIELAVRSAALPVYAELVEAQTA